MIRRRQALLSMVALPALAACHKDEPVPGPLKLTIAVIPKGTTHEFWKSVHAGAAAAVEGMHDLTLIWKGPLKEDDLKSQIDIVQSMIAQGVNGIVLAPLNDKALVNPVKAAVDAKIPVVIIDSALQSQDPITFVATDNRGAGVQSAEYLGKLLGGKGAAKGKLIVLRYQEGSASTTAREAGFLDVIKRDYQGITVVSDNQYGGATTESAFAASESLLAAHKAAEGGVDAVFCPNESTTFGMLLALQKAGLAGKIKLMGFDASEKLVQGLTDGHIEALLVQDPFKMGKWAVERLVSHLHGSKLDANADGGPRVASMDTGARLVTRADLGNPEVQALLHPDLKKWLKE